jgi:hypothetical protein
MCCSICQLYICLALAWMALVWDSKILDAEEPRTGQIVITKNAVTLSKKGDLNALKGAGEIKEGERESNWFHGIEKENNFLAV